MHGIPFVDAHVHLWELERLSYPWLMPPFADDGPNGSVAAIARDFGPADYRALTAAWDVRGVVHIDAGADPAHALAETAWLGGLADGPAGIVGFAALDDPAVGEVLAGHAVHPKVRGIRHIVNWHPDPRRSYTPRDLTRDAGWARGFGLLERYGLSFDLQCYPAQMPALVPLFAAHPMTPVIVNHLGMPVLSDPDGVAAWRAGLSALAALPQVAIKISGAGFARRDWDEASIRPFVREALDLFGADRCCVASDVPTDLLFGTLDATLGAYASILSDLSPDEQRAVWGGNANRLYRLGLDLTPGAITTGG